MLEDVRQSLQAFRISRTLRRTGALFDGRRHALQLRDFAFIHVRAFCAVDGGAQSCDAIRRQSLRAFHLIEVGLGDDQLRGPLELLLVLHIQHRHVDRLGRVNFILRQELRRREFEDVQAARDFRAVDAAIVPVGRPFAAEHEHFRVYWSAVEVGDFKRVRRVGEVHYGDAALIPGLNFDIAAGNGDERAVVRDAVFGVGLRGGQLVIAGEGQLVVMQMEDGVRAPVVGIVRTATRAEAAAPLVGEDDFAAVVRERSGVPVGIVRVIYGVDALGMNWIFNVEQNPVAGARASGETDGRVHRDVVALIGVLGLFDRLGRVFAVGTAVVQAVERTGTRINKNARAGDDLRILRRGDRNLDDVNTEQRRIRILVWSFAGTSGEFFGLTHERGT